MSVTGFAGSLVYLWLSIVSDFRRKKRIVIAHSSFLTQYDCIPCHANSWVSCPPGRSVSLAIELYKTYFPAIRVRINCESSFHIAPAA